MKYTENFNRDFTWYLKMRKAFWFSGDVLRTKNGEPLQVESSPSGITGKAAFYLYDSTGKLAPTRHPNILLAVLKAKASANFHVKLYAGDRAKGFLSGIELQEIFDELQPPAWFAQAVENTRLKIMAQPLMPNSQNT